MSIAKGKSDYENERDTFVAGFHDLIEAAEKAKKCFDDSLKADLYDLLTDSGVPRDEIETQSSPLLDLLSEQNERDIRIRKSMVIGIYSFLETSLSGLCLNKTVHKKDESYLATYTRAIYGNGKPLPQLKLLDKSFRPLRNQMTHGGKIKKQDIREIENLIKIHPEFSIKKCCNQYYIDSYSGIRLMLGFVEETLSIVEKYIKTK